MANTQNNEPTNSAQQDPGAESPRENQVTSGTDDDEFKIVVKKLDVVVKPRGVLAE